MAKQADYRISHTASNKGAVYDFHFEQFSWRKYLWEREKEILLKILDEFYAGRKIHYLDFACGTGRVLKFMKEHVDKAAGVDLSESMLAQCARKVRDVHIYRGDITREDVLGDRRFNLITAFRFFPNAQEDLRKEALDALAKNLDSDGLLVFNNHRNQSGLLFQLARLFGKKLNTMSHQEVKDLLQLIGFDIVKIYSVGVLPAHDTVGMWVPGWIHNIADQFTHKTGWAQKLCQNNIYVCRKRSLPRNIHETFEMQTHKTDTAVRKEKAREVK